MDFVQALPSSAGGEHGRDPLPNQGAHTSSRRSTLSALSLDAPLDVREGRRSSTSSSRVARPWVPSQRTRTSAAAAAAAAARSSSIYSLGNTSVHQTSREAYGLPETSDEEERVTNRVLVAPLLTDLFAATGRSRSEAVSPATSVATSASSARYTGRQDVGTQLDFEEVTGVAAAEDARPTVQTGADNEASAAEAEAAASALYSVPALVHVPRLSDVQQALAKAATSVRPLNIAPLVSSRPAAAPPADSGPSHDVIPPPPPRRSRSRSPRASASPYNGRSPSPRAARPRSPVRAGVAPTREEEMWSPIPLAPEQLHHHDKLPAGVTLEVPSPSARSPSPTRGAASKALPEPTPPRRARVDAAVQTAQEEPAAGDSPPPVSVISEPNGWGLPPPPRAYRDQGSQPDPPSFSVPAISIGSDGAFEDATTLEAVAASPLSPPRQRATSSASSVISVGSARSHSTRRTDGSFSLRRRRSGTAGSAGGGRTPSRAMSEVNGGTARRPGVEDSTLLQSVRDSFGIIELMLSEQLGGGSSSGGGADADAGAALAAAAAAAPVTGRVKSFSAPATPAAALAAKANAAAAAAAGARAPFPGGAAAAVAGAFDEYFSAAGASGGAPPAGGGGAEPDPLDGFDISAIPLGPDGEPQLDLVMTMLEALVDEREEWKKRNEGTAAATPGAKSETKPASPPGVARSPGTPLGLSMMTTRASPLPAAAAGSKAGQTPGSGGDSDGESEARTVIRMMDAVMSGSGSEDLFQESSSMQQAAASHLAHAPAHLQQQHYEAPSRSRRGSRLRRSRTGSGRLAEGDSPESGSGSRGGVPWYRRRNFGDDDDGMLGYEDEVAPYDEEGFEHSLGGGRGRGGGRSGGFRGSRAGTFYDEEVDEYDEEDDGGASFYDDPRFTSVEQTRREANEVLQLADKLDQLVTAMVGPSAAGAKAASRGREGRGRGGLEAEQPRRAASPPPPPLASPLGQGGGVPSPQPRAAPSLAALMHYSPQAPGNVGSGGAGHGSAYRPERQGSPAEGYARERQWGHARAPSPPLLPLAAYQDGRRSASPTPRPRGAAAATAGASGAAKGARSLPPPRGRAAAEPPAPASPPLQPSRSSPLRQMMSAQGANHPGAAQAHAPYHQGHSSAYSHHQYHQGNDGGGGPRLSPPPAAPSLPHMPWLPPSISGAAVSGHAAVAPVRPRPAPVSPPRRPLQPGRRGGSPRGSSALSTEASLELEEAEEAVLRASAHQAVAAFAAAQAAATRPAPAPRPAPQSYEAWQAAMAAAAATPVAEGAPAPPAAAAAAPAPPSPLQPVRLLMGPPPPVSQIKSLEELIAFYAPPGVLGAPEEAPIVLPPPLAPPAGPASRPASRAKGADAAAAGRRGSLPQQAWMHITPAPSGGASPADTHREGASQTGGSTLASTPELHRLHGGGAGSTASTPPSLITAPDEEDEDEKAMRDVLSAEEESKVAAAFSPPAPRRGSQVSFSEWLAAAAGGGAATPLSALPPAPVAAPAPVPAPWSRSAANAPPLLPAAPPQAMALAAALGIAVPAHSIPAGAHFGEGFNGGSLAGSRHWPAAGASSASGVAARPAPRLASSTARSASAFSSSGGRAASAGRAATATRGGSSASRELPGYGQLVPPPAVPLPLASASASLGRRLPWEPKYPGLHL